MPSERAIPHQGHRRVGIACGGFAERANGFVVIESEDELEALIEPALRVFGVGRDRTVVGVEAFEESRARGPRRDGVDGRATGEARDRDGSESCQRRLETGPVVRSPAER